MFNPELFTFDSPLNLAYGLLTGIVFGFLLQRGAVTRFHVIVGQFLWRDHTVLRTMLTAVAVGAVGVWAVHLLLDAPLHIKNATLWGNAVGGIIFGIGMAILGYCPGTGVAALGDGSRHAWPGVLGMLVGAAVYAELHAKLSVCLLKPVDLGKVTFADLTHLNHWWFVLGVVVLAVVVLRLLHGRGVKAA